MFLWIFDFGLKKNLIFRCDAISESARANQLPRTPRKSSVFKFGHNVPHLKKISVSSAPSLSSPLFQLGNPKFDYEHN